MKDRIILFAVMLVILSNETCLAQLRWPVAPQNQQASIAGTVGEYRETKNDAGIVVGYRFHRGVDITNGSDLDDLNVYATNSGQVHLTPGGFWACNIQIGDVYYFHVNFEVEEDQNVQAGDLIGTMRRDGPIHVHYQRNDANFLNNYFLYPFDDETDPTISSHAFHVNGLTRTNSTPVLNTIRNIAGQSYTLTHNKIDLVVNASDTRLNPQGGIGTAGAVAPFQFSYEIYDSENQSINGEQISIRYDRVPLQNAAASDVFGPGTTYTNLNWILTSSPFDINPATNGYGRYLNTRLRNGVTEDWSSRANLDARYNGEAMYKDGLYKIEMRVRDVDDDDTFNEAERVGYFLIDNFRPYVKEVIVKQNNESGPLIYRGYWEWNGSRLKLYSIGPPALSAAQNVWIKVITSESMANLTINMPTVDGTVYRNMNLVSGTKNTEFTIAYTSSAISAGPNQLKFDGRDFNDNPLEKMLNSIPQTPEVNVSIRQNATTWLPAANPGVDQNHVFNGASDICGNPGGRIATNGRLNGTCLYVGFDASKRQVVPGVSVVFTNLSLGGNGTLSYQWNFGSGASPATATTAGPHTVAYSTAGSKTVSLTVTDSEGSETSTQTNYISVSTTSSGDFNASPTTGGATLTVNFSAPSATNWSWNFPGGSPSTSTQQTPAVTYSSAGIYDVTLTMDGISTTKYGLITVTSVPALAATIVNCSNYYFTNCATGYRERETIYFAGEVSGGQPFYTYIWNFGDGTTSTQFDPVHIYNTAGSYNVSLTITDLRGVSVTTSTTVNIISIVPQITANFTASDTYISTGDGPVIFTDATTSNVDLNNAQYYWDFGDGAYPRYAYSRGPHTVCYNNIVNYKSVYLFVSDPFAYKDDNERKTNYIYVSSDNLNKCDAFSPKWVTSPGANVVAAQSNCNFTDLVGINNGDFSTINCTEDGINGTYGKCAFSSGGVCLGHPFYSSHGDPSLINTDKGKTLRLWTGGHIGEETNAERTRHTLISSEGLYYRHPVNFRPGETYRFSFYAKPQSLNNFYAVDHIKVSLTNGLQPFNSCNGDGESYSLPNYAFALHELGTFNYSTAFGEWRCYVVSFIPPTGGFNQIWVYPTVEESLLPIVVDGNPVTIRESCLLVDNFSLRSYDNDCPTDALVDGNSPIQAIYKAESNILTSGSVILNSGYSSSFAAGLSVNLKPGFNAKYGSTFTAKIESCNINTSGRFVDLEADSKIFYREHFPENIHANWYDAESNNATNEVGIKVVLNPNPARNNIIVSINQEKSDPVKISIINITGYELQFKISKSLTYVEEQFDLSNLSKGIYLVKVITSQGMVVKKFILE